MISRQRTRRLCGLAYVSRRRHPSATPPARTAADLGDGWVDAPRPHRESRPARPISGPRCRRALGPIGNLAAHPLRTSITTARAWSNPLRSPKAT